MQKILGIFTEARLSNRSPKSQAKERSKPPLAVGWIASEIVLIVLFFFVPGSKNSQIRKRWIVCSDFGEKLEVLDFCFRT